MPFQNESESFQLDDLTIENRFDRIALYCSLQITRDKVGLKLAQDLNAFLDAAVSVLQAQKLPDHVPIAPTDKVKNPFD
jgi:hypothetical protein